MYRISILSVSFESHQRVVDGLTINLLDPFADERDPLADSADVGSTADNIHIRIQQRNGRKTLTTLQGLPKRESLSPLTSIFLQVQIYLFQRTEYDQKKLLKAFKKVSGLCPFIQTPKFHTYLTTPRPIMDDQLILVIYLGIRLQRYCRR